MRFLLPPGRRAIVVFGALAFAACTETGSLGPDFDVPGPLASVVAPYRLVFPVKPSPGYNYCATPMDTNGDGVGDLSFDFGFKIPNGGLDAAGTYEVPGMGTITVTTVDGITWNWTSTFGIDAAISKGGQEYGQLYVYDSERTEDTDLFSSTNVNGVRQAISHLHFCFDLEVDVSTSAVTRYTRDYDWFIGKTAAAVVQWADRDGDGQNDPGYLKLNSGGETGVAYTVQVGLDPITPFVERDFEVAGEVTVQNGTPATATLSGLEDVIDGIGAIALDCSLPVTLGPGETLTCSYATALPDKTPRVNTATATMDGAIWDSGDVELDGGTVFYGAGAVGGGSATADVLFGDPTDLIDETVTVGDTYTEFGAPRIVGLGGARFDYTKLFGGIECGTSEHENIASYTGESGEAGSATYVVTLDIVGCDGNVGVCTLTQGYWKTHSTYGPASKPDATWDAVGGPDALFMSSGLSWLELFRTSPKGDAYIVLAHQYMAAQLNRLKGADTASIAAVLAEATVILQGHTLGSLKKAADKNRAIELAGILDQYNNGLIGPGHCSDAPADH